jgi:hypothetical protein
LVEVLTSRLAGQILATFSLFLFTAAGSLTASEPLKPGQLLDALNGAETHALKIVVIAGQGGRNVLDRALDSPTIVQVVGQDGQPTVGADVTFTLPGDGPGGVFSNGSHSFRMLSDDAGRVQVTGIRPVGTGAFTLVVSASFQGSTASASIMQTNYATAEAAAANFKNAPTAVTGARPPGLSARAKVGIIAGIAAVALAGALVALNRGSGSKSASAVLPTASISLAGAPTTGTPH